MVKCEYHNKNTKIRGRSIFCPGLYVKYNYFAPARIAIVNILHMTFLDFWVKENYLILERTFAIFSAAQVISELFRLSTITLFPQQLLLSVV